MSKRTTIPAPVGGSSLLVIFAVLCLTVFALLGLATVTADKRLADDSYEAVKAYYQADCEAEKILGEIREGRMPEGVVKENQSYSYSCPISETQELRVVVKVDGGTYAVEQWRIVSTVQWQPDEYIDLLDLDSIMER